MNLQVYYRSELELLTCKAHDCELKYRVYQIYGQKYIKLMESSLPLERTTEVYASNIPRNIGVENLFRFFAQCGQIFQIRLLMDFSGYNRGRCFVQYYQVVSCRRAVCCLHDEIIEDEHRVIVKLSLNNNQLILKSIPSWVSEAEMRDFVVNNIGEGLTSFLMKKSRVPRRSYCFCTYRDHQFAMMAHKKSWPYLNLNGAVIDVHWAVPEILRYSENLYFTNICRDLTKAEFFEVLVNILDVKTMVEFRMTKTHGFITLTNSKTLKTAEIALQNLTIRGVPLLFSRTPFRTNQRQSDSQHIANHPCAPAVNTVSGGSFPQALHPVGYVPVQNQNMPFQVNMPIFMPSNFTPIPTFPFNGFSAIMPRQ